MLREREGNLWNNTNREYTRQIVWIQLLNWRLWCSPAQAILLQTNSPFVQEKHYVTNYFVETWLINSLSRSRDVLPICVLHSSLSSGPAISNSRTVMGFLSVRPSLVGLTTASTCSEAISPDLVCVVCVGVVFESRGWNKSEKLVSNQRIFRQSTLVVKWHKCRLIHMTCVCVPIVP